MHDKPDYIWRSITRRLSACGCLLRYVEDTNPDPMLNTSGVYTTYCKEHEDREKLPQTPNNR